MARLRQAVLRPAEPARSQACFGQRAAHGIKGAFGTTISRDAIRLFLGIVGQRQPNFQLAGFLRVQGLPRRRIVHRDKAVVRFADTRHNLFLACGCLRRRPACTAEPTFHGFGLLGRQCRSGKVVGRAIGDVVVVEMRVEVRHNIAAA